MRLFNLLVLLLSTLSLSSQAVESRVLAGLQSPESVLIGPDGRVYVSEIGEFGRDGDGRIRVLSADGQWKVFAEGLDDPKGLAVFGNNLYVADKTRVLRIGMDGRWTVFAAATAFPTPPQFLNDLEADAQGNLYVSDSGDLNGHGGAIYRIAKSGRVAQIVSGAADARCLAPNGLLMAGTSHLLTVDFVSGVLYRVKLRTGEMEPVASGFGGGDGIVRGSGGTLYVSDWKNGKVFSVSPSGEVRVTASGYQAAADLGVTRDGAFLLVPDMKAGSLHWLPVHSRSSESQK